MLLPRRILRHFLTAPFVVLFGQIHVRLRGEGAQDRYRIDHRRKRCYCSAMPVELGSIELDQFLLIRAPCEVPQRDSTANRVPKRSCNCTSSASAATLLLHAIRRSPAYRSARPRCSSTAKNDAAPRKITFGRPVHRPAPRCSAGLQLVAPHRHLSATFRDAATLLNHANRRSPVYRSAAPSASRNSEVQHRFSAVKKRRWVARQRRHVAV